MRAHARAHAGTRVHTQAHTRAHAGTRRHTEPRASYLPPAASSSQPFRRGHTYQLLMLTDVLLVISPFPCQAERRAERAQAAWQDAGRALRAASFASGRVHSHVTAKDESVPLSASASPGQTSEQAGSGSYWEEESCKGSLLPLLLSPPTPSCPEILCIIETEGTEASGTDVPVTGTSENSRGPSLSSACEYISCLARQELALEVIAVKAGGWMGFKPAQKAAAPLLAVSRSHITADISRKARRSRRVTSDIAPCPFSLPG